MLEAPGARVTLEIRSDHSSSEIIKLSDASEQRTSDIWHWSDGDVCTTALLLPRSFQNGLYEEPPAFPKPTVVGDAYQEDRCMGLVLNQDDFGDRSGRRPKLRESRFKTERFSMVSMVTGG